MYMLISISRRNLGSVLTEMILALNKIDVPPSLEIKLSAEFVRTGKNHFVLMNPFGSKKYSKKLERWITQQYSHAKQRHPHGGLAVVRQEMRMNSPNRPKAGRRNGSRK